MLVSWCSYDCDSIILDFDYSDNIYGDLILCSKLFSYMQSAMFIDEFKMRIGRSVLICIAKSSTGRSSSTSLKKKLPFVTLTSEFFFICA